MAASINDLITQATVNSRPVPTTVSSPRTAGVTTLQCLALTGWATGSAIHFVTYKINTAGLKIAGSQCDWKGIVSGTTVTGIVLKAGTDVGNAVGDIVEAAPTGAYANDLYSFATQDHDTQGRHKDLHGANGLTVHGLTDTASAVNNLRSTNSITGVDPTLSAEGGDTNVGQIFQPKGLGNSRVKGRADGWNDLSGFGTFTYNANNGQKEYVITTPSDLSSFLSVGQRMRFDRSVAPPTQAMAFTAASSQYGTKATPAGISFTAAFSAEAWVFLNSYTAQRQYIVSRTDGTTGGWYFRLEAGGQITIGYGTASTFTEWASYQCMPLKRWVHLAGVVSSTTTKTLQGIYMNGVSVATSSTSSAAANLTQVTSNLSVGASNAGIASTFLDGYISEVRVWSVAQSAANILANMAISLLGSETNLVALFQGNGNFNDKTSNANNLTATNGAIATQAVNPYNTTEYGLISKVTSTQLTIFMGTDYNIPNAALTNPYYSTVKAPAGFNPARGKWTVDALFRTTLPTSGSNAINSWYKLTGSDFSIPTGDFDIEWSGLAITLNASAGGSTFRMQLDTVTPTYDRPNAAVNETKLTTDANFPMFDRSPREPVSNTAITTYSLYGKTTSGGGATSTITFDSTPVIFKAECAYI